MFPYLIFQMRQEIETAFNGPGEKFHEEQHVECEVRQTSFGFFVPVYLYQIGQGLKSIERNAQREERRPVAGHEPDADERTHRTAEYPRSQTGVTLAVKPQACIKGQERDT